MFVVVLYVVEMDQNLDSLRVGLTILSFSKCFLRRYRVDAAELFVKNGEGKWAKGLLSGYPQGFVH
jgi:hypothetical protein